MRPSSRLRWLLKVHRLTAELHVLVQLGQIVSAPFLSQKGQSPFQLKERITWRCHPSGCLCVRFFRSHLLLSSLAHELRNEPGESELLRKKLKTR